MHESVQESALKVYIFICLYRKIETYNGALSSLCAALNEAIKIRGKSAPGSLIPLGKHEAIGLFNMSDSIDQKPFYGRCIALHVSVQYPLNFELVFV